MVPALRSIAALCLFRRGFPNKSDCLFPSSFVLSPFLGFRGIDAINDHSSITSAYQQHVFHGSPRPFNPAFQMWRRHKASFSRHQAGHHAATKVLIVRNPYSTPLASLATAEARVLVACASGSPCLLAVFSVHRAFIVWSLGHLTTLSNSFASLLAGRATVLANSAFHLSRRKRLPLTSAIDASSDNENSA